HSGTWTGSPAPTYAYQWQSCNSLGESCSNISGATSSTYELTEAELGDTIVVHVTATNASGSAGASSMASATGKAPRPPLPAACAVNATPEACVAASLTAGFPEKEIAVDEFGDFFWGSSGPAVYASGTNDEFDVYENGAEVAEGHIFRANVSSEGSL